MNIFNVFDQIRQYGAGSNAIKDVLNANKSSELQQILKYAYDPYIQYYVRGNNSNLLEKIGNINGTEDIALNSIFQLLDDLSNRIYTGNAAVDKIYELLNNAKSEYIDLFLKILNKDLKLGLSEKTINKVFPKTIREWDVMACQSLNKTKTKEIDIDKLSKLKYPVLVDLKRDGVRHTYNGADEKTYTRNGKTIEGFEHIKNICNALNKKYPGIILDGELEGGTWNETMNNLNRITDKQDAHFKFVLFDCLLNADDKTNAFNRRERVKKILEIEKIKELDVFKCVEHKYCNTPQEVLDYFNEIINDGHEGVVVKTDSPYEFKRSKFWLKMKEFKSSEFKVIRAELGDPLSKHANRLGAFIVDNNGVEVSVGSGYSDEEREYFWNNQDKYIGHLLEVSYKKVTKDGSLEFPSFVKFRFDLED